MSTDKRSCFVIIGYGEKVSYATGTARTLNLDQTYKYLIKPVFDQLGIDCYRAIDKNINSSIDEVMLQEIMNADIALADISTLNANVMWELGVRHTLKPHHTIMICEKEQMKSLPFDINRFVVHQYTHSPEGIPFTEVERFTGYLKSLVQKILDEAPAKSDSPVHLILKNNLSFINPQNTGTKGMAEAGEETFASLMEKAEKAKKDKDFITALTLFARAKEEALKSAAFRDNISLIVSRLALCTYKSKMPDEKTALEKAQEILKELHPEQSIDIEVLGLSGAISKRLYDITNVAGYLDNAIAFYEKGFELKKDYYNGINTVFMLYKKSAVAKQQGEEWDEVKIKADYIRNTVLKICLELENKNDFAGSSDAVWVLYTIAEAYHYKQNEAKMKEYEEKGLLKNDSFATASYNEQKEKIIGIMNILK